MTRDSRYKRAFIVIISLVVLYFLVSNRIDLFNNSKLLDRQSTLLAHAAEERRTLLAELHDLQVAQARNQVLILQLRDAIERQNEVILGLCQGIHDPRCAIITPEDPARTPSPAPSASKQTSPRPRTTITPSPTPTATPTQHLLDPVCRSIPVLCI